MKDKKGLLAVIASIVGWLIWVVALVVVVDTDSAVMLVLTTGIIPFALGIAAVCLGIWSIVKKERNWIRIIAIIGIILGILLILCSGFCLFSYAYYVYLGGSMKDLMKTLRESANQAIEERQRSLNP